jgi:phage shock protein E
MQRRSFLARLFAAALVAGFALSAGAASPVVIDVRTPQEYSGGHVEGALNLPHDTIAEHIAAAVPDKDTPVILYCHSGRRAEIALKTLKDLGYSQVENYGGYEAAKKRLGGG